LRAPRRRSEIQRPERCLTTSEFLPDRSTTEMVDHRTHVLAMNFRLFTFQRTLPKTTDGGEKPPRSFRRNACNRLPQMQSCLAFDFCFPRRRVANNIAISSPVNRCRKKSFCDLTTNSHPHNWREQNYRLAGSEFLNSFTGQQLKLLDGSGLFRSKEIAIHREWRLHHQSVAVESTATDESHRKWLTFKRTDSYTRKDGGSSSANVNFPVAICVARANSSRK